MADVNKSPVPKTPVFFNLAYRYRKPNGKVTITPRWGILGALFALGIIGLWVVSSSFFYFWYKHKRGYEEARYWPMYLMVFDRGDLRQDMGNYHIQQAFDLIDNGEFGKAFYLLRVGLQNAPGNLKGRLQLADFFYTRQPDAALTILQEGMQYARGDQRYIESYFAKLSDQQADNRVIEIADDLIADPNVDEQTKKMAAFFKAKAQTFRGNYDQAEDTLAEHDIGDSTEGLSLTAELLWASGNKEAAIDFLEEKLEANPNEDFILSRLSRYYRENGQYDQARRFTTMRITANPLAMGPKLDLLYIYDLADEEQRRERMVDFLLKNKAKDSPEALIQLARYASAQGRIDLMREIYGIALERDYPIQEYAILLIRTHIEAGDFQGAENFSEELENESPAWMQDSQPILNSLRAIALKGIGEDNLSFVYLQNFLESQALVRTDYLLYLASEFEKIEAYRHAHRIMEFAYRKNSNNQAALSKLIEMDLKLGNSKNLGERIDTLLGMRRPSTDLLQNAYRQLGSDEFIFAESRAEILDKLNEELAKRAVASLPQT